MMILFHCSGLADDVPVMAAGMSPFKAESQCARENAMHRKCRACKSIPRDIFGKPGGREDLFRQNQLFSRCPKVFQAEAGEAAGGFPGHAHQGSCAHVNILF